MSKLRIGIVIAALGALALVVAGCGGGGGGSTGGGSSTPATSAPATTPPATTPTATSTPSTPAATTTTPAGGDVAAGKTFFVGTCQGCHLEAGTKAGFGPKLQGLGVDEQRIRDQVTNGGNAMPAGLASGTDLDNVTAYVLSLQ